jgi:hypothetical protein
MRSGLSKDEGVRKKFYGTFSRLGKKRNYNGYSEDTILLVNIIDAESSELAADHAWFSYTKGFEKVQLKEGTVLEFEARVKAYAKGYVNRGLGMTKRKTDLKLSHPTQIKIRS